MTVFITFEITNVALGNQEFINSLIGNTNGKINAKHMTFYRTYSGLGLLISKAHGSTYIAIATIIIVQSQNQTLNFLPQNQAVLI